MPGLVAVIGVDDAQRLVTTSARPLLRRPWQRLTVASSPEGRVALGHAGERGGVVEDRHTGVIVACDGELWDDDSHLLPEQRTLDAFLAAGPDLEPPDGFFAATVWDPRTRTVSLITDRVGSRQLFLARRGRAVLVASELKALLHGGVTPELNLDGWAQLLTYELLVGDSTPLAGVRIVPPGTVLTISETGEERLREHWRYQLAPADDADPAELVEELGRRLVRAARRRDGERSVLALSGGLDSRCLTTVTPPGAFAVTFGMRGSADLELGGKVAARASLRHRALELEPGYVARDAAATVWLTEGQIRCFHSHHLALGRLRWSDERSERLTIGFAGDPVMRWGAVALPTSEPALVDYLHADLSAAVTDALMEELLTTAFAATLRGRARTSLAGAVADEEGDPTSRRNQLGFRQIYRRKVLPGGELFADDLAARDPFTDSDLIDLTRAMPHSLRTDGSLQRSYLRRFPDIARVANPTDGLAPSLHGVRRSASAQVVRARRRMRTLTEAPFPATRWKRRAGIGDYSTDLRHGGPELLGVLLERRTLTRGQIREEPVRRLIAETLDGRRTDVKALGMLLTLELFQRQFVDGDGAPARLHDDEPDEPERS